MSEGSSDLAKARHGWEQRNSNGMNCYDEDGALTECQSPPDLIVTESLDIWPAMAATLLRPESESEYQRSVVLMRHAWGVENPDV